MTPLNPNDVVGFVAANFTEFDEARLNVLKNIALGDLFNRDNPYLRTFTNILTCGQLVKTNLDAFLSSQEEGLFGEFLEKLAIFVCGQVYGGKKSAATGIDLEFDRDNVTYVVAIKSGPNWGNSRQIAGMRADFKTAIRTLYTNNRTANVQAVNGCCYGRDASSDKGDYQKLCGQKFWEFISDDRELYKQIVEPLGHQAKERNDKFALLYNQVINRFDREVLKDFVSNDLVDWDKLVEFISAEKRPVAPRKR